MTDAQWCEELFRPSAQPEQAEDAKLTAMRSAVIQYRAETLQWAERRSATQPSLAARARRGERWAALPRWSLATVAVMTIAAGVAHVYDERSSTTESVAVSASVITAQKTRVSPNEIAADNELMKSIDAELSYRAHTPVEAFDSKHISPRWTGDNRTAGSEE